jgi:large subunit ribosomal protein L17
MRHKIAGRKLGRTSAHRQALFANLATSLLQHGQIRTTLPKAKDLRSVVEPLITKARAGTLAARREVARTIKDESVVKKLFDEIAPRFKETPGGYTRVLKAGFRQGDSAPMAVIELTEGKPHTPKKKEKPAPVKKEASKPAVADKSAAEQAEKPVVEAEAQAVEPPADQDQPSQEEAKKE